MIDGPKTQRDKESHQPWTEKEAKPEWQMKNEEVEKSEKGEREI